MPSVLIVLSSATKTLTGNPTGWYLPEAAQPYYVLEPHATIDFAAPGGPNPQVDAYSTYKDESSVKFLADETVKAKLASAKKLTEVKVEDYDAVFYVGGHAPVLDLASDPNNAKLASDFWNSNKIVSAVCHGSAALVQAVDTDGKSIFAGRRATGFSSVEEEALNTTKEIPFMVQDRVSALGGIYEKAAEPWAPHVVVDGRLITGQNPASGVQIAEALLAALKAA